MTKIERYLEVQKQQLEQWKKKLKSEVYMALVCYCSEQNLEIKKASDVVRGDSLTHFVLNWNND